MMLSVSGILMEKLCGKISKEDELLWKMMPRYFFTQETGNSRYALNMEVETGAGGAGTFTQFPLRLAWPSQYTKARDLLLKK